MNVIEITPHVLDNICPIRFGVAWVSQRIYGVRIEMISICALDKRTIGGVFIFTLLNASVCEQDQSLAARPQAQCLAPFWHPPSPSPTSDRLTLCSTRFFRSPRHTPGQIRNAPSSSDGWASHQPHRRSLWLLAAHLLPGPSRFQSRRLGRLTTSEARTASGAQALGGDPGLCRRVARQRRSFVHARTPQAYPAEIRLVGPSSQPGTGTGSTQKKTPVVQQRRHLHKWLRPMSWWPIMKPYEARSWDLSLREVPVQDGLVWSAKAWLLGCKRFRYQRQRPCQRPAPIQWPWPACNPKWPMF